MNQMNKSVMMVLLMLFSTVAGIAYTPEAEAAQVVQQLAHLIRLVVAQVDQPLALAAGLYWLGRELDAIHRRQRPLLPRQRLQPLLLFGELGKYAFDHVACGRLLMEGGLALVGQ